MVTPHVDTIEKFLVDASEYKAPMIARIACWRLGGGFKYLCMFISAWVNDRIWRAYFFKSGLKPLVVEGLRKNQGNLKESSCIVNIPYLSIDRQHEMMGRIPSDSMQGTTQKAGEIPCIFAFFHVNRITTPPKMHWTDGVFADIVIGHWQWQPRQVDGFRFEEL